MNRPYRSTLLRHVHASQRFLYPMVMAGMATTLATGMAMADNRFNQQGSAVSGVGTLGAGSVTVHHNLLAAERDEILDLISSLESSLGSEVERLETLLEVTRVSLAGDIEAVEAQTQAAQLSANNAQASADQALTHAQTLFNQLAQLEQDVVATQLAVQYAQAAADSAQSTADQARAEAAVAKAAADAADALAALARVEAANAQSTGNMARNEASAAQNTANTALSRANTARNEAGAAQSTADTALARANTARSEASSAQSTADTALARANTARSEAGDAQSTANTALSRANTARNEAANALSAAEAAEVLARKGIADALKAFNEAKSAQTSADAAQKRADDAYELAQRAFAIGVPSGAYAYFHGTTCPSGWAHANGQNGTVDLRGEFIRTWDAGRGKDTGRGARSSQQDTTRFPAPVYMMNHGFGPYGIADGYGNMPTPMSFVVTDDAIGWRGGDQHDQYYGYQERAYQFESNETRPSNVALLACMKR